MNKTEQIQNLRKTKKPIIPFYAVKSDDEQKPIDPKPSERLENQLSGTML